MSFTSVLYHHSQNHVRHTDHLRLHPHHGTYFHHIGLTDIEQGLKELMKELTSATSTTTEHCHLFKLRRNVCIGFTQYINELSCRLGIVGGKVGVGRALHSGALKSSK